MRRIVAALVTWALLAGLPGTALAFDSGQNPGAPGANSITWTGQGAVDGVLGTSICGTENGAAIDGSYLLWILTVDGGTISNTPGETPHLDLTAEGQTTTYDVATQNRNAWHFVTPYVAPDPTSLGATAYFTVTSTGGGAWILTISHGCAPAVLPPASELTIVDADLGGYDLSYGWTIEKSAATGMVHTAGGALGTATYTVTVGHDAGTVSDVRVLGDITITNPNAAPVFVNGATVQLTDGLASEDFTCFVMDDGPMSIPANDATTLTYACTLTELPEEPLTAVAQATWDDQTLANGADLPGGSVEVTAGIGFTVDTTTDECVAVTDSSQGTLGTVCVGDADPTVFTYEGTIAGPSGTCTVNGNTATYTTNDTATTGSAEAKVNDCQGADLTAATTADPAFTRTASWNVTKAVDKTLVEQQSGSATFTYTVKASQTGATDSAWTVTGTITVHNPNDWEPVSLTGVSDAVDNGGSCTVEGDRQQTIPAEGDSVGLTYTCVYATAPSPATGTNTATATWDAAAASTPTGSASAGAGFAFGEPTTRVDWAINVTDSFNGTAGALGTLTATDAAPFATTTFTYERTITVPTWNCVTIDNVAQLTETGQSAGRSVEVCGPAKTGALTIGYWQNKNNGQAIIKASAAPGGACALGTWLWNTYAPFREASLAGDCSKVATYVASVLGSASASGSTMNAMLKGQLLAAALDVYFSDPALGGNVLKAPAPLGSVQIDVTRICTDLTCKAYEDSSPAFGGSPRLTVAEILAYAASQSNVGGSSWYGQVKATQELAKDVFDALNNLKVFAP